MQSLNNIKSSYLSYIQDNKFDYLPTELYQPVDYILGLGGKRIRPLFVLIASQIFNGNLEEAFPAAYAIDIFHNFSLVHDDIMDNASLRRGLPTVHAKYDNNTAILSGDVMLIYAYSFLSKSNDPALVSQLIKHFNDTAIKVCQGQQLDINFETSQQVSIDQYLQMIEWKTAVLLASSLFIGAKIAQSSLEDSLNLYQFGLNIGLAFQIQDDLLDTYGDPQKFGKKVGGDILQNKKTILYLKALQATKSKKQKNNMIQLYASITSTPHDEQLKIKKIKNIFDQLKVPQMINQMIDSYIQKANTHLSQIVPSNKQSLDLLITFTESLANRDS